MQLVLIVQMPCILGALYKREYVSSLLLAIPWKLSFHNSTVQKRLKPSNTMQQKGPANHAAFSHMLHVPVQKLLSLFSLKNYCPVYLLSPSIVRQISTWLFYDLNV